MNKKIYIKNLSIQWLDLYLKGVHKQPLDIRTHASKGVYFPVFHCCTKKNSTMIDSPSIFYSTNLSKLIEFIHELAHTSL